MQQRPKLRKREIVLGIAAGALAAAASAVIIEASRDRDPIVAMATADQAPHALAQFAKISTVGPEDVVVTTGDAFSVRMSGDPGALGRLQAVVENGELKIGPKGSFGGSWRRLSGATVYVTVPRLEAIAIAGSGSVKIDRAEGERFDGTIAGPGELTIGTLKAGRADFSLAGPGDLTVGGTASDTHIALMGSGEIHAGGLRSDTATIAIGGSGDVELNVSREASVSIMGSGDVDITGGAKCSVSRMGSGDVSCNGQEVER